MKPNIKFVFAAFLILVSLILVDLNNSYAQTPQEILNQYVAELKNNPNDTALREKIIKHVQGMKQKPAVPESAREHFVMATALQKAAKDKNGYEMAIKEYQEALLIAPWWPEAYSNMGVLQKMAGQYDEAIQSLKFYLLTNPPDARNAQDEIYNIKAAKKMAEVKTESPAEKPKSDLDVSGRWIAVQGKGVKCAAILHTIFELDDDKLSEYVVFSDSYYNEIGACGDPNRYRGKTILMGTYYKSGENEFKYTDFAGVLHKIQFIGDSAFISVMYEDGTVNGVARRQK